VTSGSGVTSRSELYSSTLISMLKYTGNCIYDQKLIGQISALIIKNNRIDHPEGGNDDMVIAGLLSYWILTHGKNLNLYGIDTSSLLKHNKVYLAEKYAVVEDDYSEQEVMELEHEFNELIESYKKESNDIIARQIEIRIKKLAADLRVLNHVISVEDLLENISRERKLKARRLI